MVVWEESSGCGCMGGVKWVWLYGWGQVGVHYSIK